MADRHGDYSLRIRGVQAGWNMTSDSAWVLTGDNRRFFQSRDLLVEATPWLEEERISPP